MPSPSHKTFRADDIPDLSSKTILVTGGNSGLGAESILQFARHGRPRIFMGARSQVKADEAIASIKREVPEADITVLLMDLADLASVRAAAETFLAASRRLDLLLNNAGIMQCPAALTKDDFEVQLGTNHVGHALLTKLLLPVLESTAQAAGAQADIRIVNLSSRANLWAPKQGLLLDTALTPMTEISTRARYGQSKLANIFFTQELAKRYPSIRSVAVHPGAVNTNLVQGLQKSFPWVPGFVWPILMKIFTVPVTEGALNQLWASCSADAKSGEFYDPVGKLGRVSGHAKDEKMAETLWSWTEEQLGKRGF